MTPVLTSRVAWRYLARDFSTEKALEKYLHDHPQADKHKHHVTKHEEQGGKDEGHGKKDEGHGDAHHEGEHGHGGGMFSGLKGALKAVAKQFKSAPKDVQKFISDPEHRKNALKKGVEGIKKAPGSYWDELVKASKHEVKEFKTAGQGMAAVIRGKKANKEQKHAMKTVAFHMGITIAAAALTTSSPALAALSAGKALAKHIALKAATEALGDLHVLQEMAHIGHGAHHPIVHALEHLLRHVKLAKEQGDDDGKQGAPEELFAALVAKHVADQVANLDDDTLAEGLGGGGDDDDGEGQQKQAADRLTSLYLAQTRVASKVLEAYLQKTARPKLSPWDGEDHEWPAVAPSWDEEPVRSDRFHDVFVMRYVDFGLAGSPMVTVDTTPWTHHKQPEFTYSIQVFDQKVKSGKIPLDGYEKSIPKLLDEAVEFAQREVNTFAKQLDQLKVPHWGIEYDKRGDDLIVQYKPPGQSPYSDSSLSGSFYGPLDIFTGGKADYDISYSAGADYEGHYGVRELKGEVRSLEDIKKVLKDAERIWASAEKQKSN